MPIRGAVLLLTLLALLAVPGSAGAAAAGEIPAGRTLVVVGQSGVDKMEAFAAATGTRPSGAMWYFGLYEDITPFLAQIDEAVARHPRLLPNVGVSFGAVSTPSPSYSAAIAAGVYDARIRQLADWLKKLSTTVYLRLGYEFDLLGGQYGPPEVYKAAYRRVVDLLRAAGVTNAAFVWHSAGAFWRATDPSLFAVSSGTVGKALDDNVPAPLKDPQPITAFYPGRDYVDAFGISYWGDSCCFGRSSEQARALYEKRTREILAQARELGLPLHISESTPVYVGADSGSDSVEWLDKAFTLVDEFDIRMWNLISIDWQEGGFFAAPFWNGYWPDARIHAFDDTRARYVAGVSSERFTGPKPVAKRKAKKRRKPCAKRKRRGSERRSASGTKKCRRARARSRRKRS